MLISCFAYSSTLRMEAICTTETSDNFLRTARTDIAEDRNHLGFKFPLKITKFHFDNPFIATIKPDTHLHILP
jgi:hypothetical protein